MKTLTRLFPLGLLLAVGLWACQDQVVTPEVQPSFAKGGSKPPKPQPQQMRVGFMHPDDDPRWETVFGDRQAGRVDISADPQLIDAQVDEDGVLSFEGDGYHLVLHFQEELDATDLPEGVSWCESEVCARGSGCQPAEGFNLLQDLQTLSTFYGGLTGQLDGHSGSWGIDFGLTVEEGDVISAGEYLLDTWNIVGRSQGEYPDGLFSDENPLDGYGWWRSWNSPVRVFRKDLNSKKNAIWSHITTCGYFDPGNEYRRVAHEIFAKPAPAEG